MAGRHLSSGFAFLQSLQPRFLAGRWSPGRLLSWTSFPFSTSGAPGPLAAGFTCPLCSALRVWLPSRRFSPSGPAPALFRTGGAPGIRPAEPSPSARYRRRFRRDEPACRCTCRFSNRGRGGPARQAAASGLSPWQKSLARDGEISTAAAGCSPGLCPGPERRTRAWSAFADRAWRGPRRPVGTPRSRIQGWQACARPDTDPASRTGTDRPVRELAPARPRTCRPSAARPMGSAHAASCIAVDRRRSVGGRRALP